MRQSTMFVQSEQGNKHPLRSVMLHDSFNKKDYTGNSRMSKPRLKLKTIEYQYRDYMTYSLFVGRDRMRR